MLQVRRAEVTDFEGIVSLQNINSIKSLSEEQKRDGFLSANFSAEQFSAMNDNLAVIVAVQDNEIEAFLCASTIEFNESFALPKTMIETFPLAKYESKPLTDWQVCIAGPVCIDVSVRGQGILKKLYERLYQVAANSYELAVVFVDLDNTRSIAAHKKVGMQVLTEFSFNARRYVIMAGKMTST